MRDFAGKTAFITGGASGFGLVLARELGALDMRVMLADIDAEALTDAVQSLRAAGATAESVQCDVADRASMQAACARTRAAFGDVHLLCNNAGVLVAGSGDRLGPADWDWLYAVNVMGAVNGLAAFLPGMLAHGQDAHVLNTASIAGIKAFAYSGPYCSSKSALIAISEAVRAELADSRIGLTALCPGFMQTAFFESGRKRQARYGGPRAVWETVSEETKAQLTGEMEAGQDPRLVARIAIAGIRDDRFIVFTQPENRGIVEQRNAMLIDALDWLDRLPVTE